jgi:ELWxxDGT repeat protein
MSGSKALFKSTNNLTTTVWVTDGTPSGTFRLPSTPDAGYSDILLITIIPGTVTSSEFQQFGNKIIYFWLESSNRLSPSSQLQLYTTDGTTAGTSEHTLAVDVNNLENSIGGGQLAQVGNKLLIFDQAISVVGQPPTVKFLLTDGTAAGTTTFTIPGPPLPLGFNPGPFFSFGNLILFSATDYGGSTSLWVSDGTAAGTKPLSIAGAAGVRSASNLTILLALAEVCCLAGATLATIPGCG